MAWPNYFKRFKNNTLLLFFVGLVIVGLGVSQVNLKETRAQANSCISSICRISANSSIIINAHDQAWLVINNDNTHEIFIPIKTATEWAQFRIYHPVQVALVVPGDPCDLPWGGTINHLQTVTAFQSTSAEDPACCVSEVRTCNDGVLSGTYTNSSCSDSCMSCGDVVSYSGQNYNTVQIGDQCWMKENLNVGVMLDYSTVEASNNSTTEKYCLNNDPAMCAQNGALYIWDEAFNYAAAEGAQGICPSGWHIPSARDWNMLELNALDRAAYSELNISWGACSDIKGEEYANRCQGAANYLKDVTYGSGTTTGNNQTGFSAKMTGAIGSLKDPNNDPLAGDYQSPSSYAYFLTSSTTTIPANGSNLRYIAIGEAETAVYQKSAETPATALAVRCVADSFSVKYTADRGGRIEGQKQQYVIRGNNASTVTATPNSPMTVFERWSDGVLTASRTDLNISEDLDVIAYFTSKCGGEINYEGEKYPVVAIGNQCWTAKNLNVGRVQDFSPSDNGIIEKVCLPEDPDCSTQGGIYSMDELMNYSIVPGSQGICPSGWHVGTNQEWLNLETTTLAIIDSEAPQFACDISNNEFDRCGDFQTYSGGWPYNRNEKGVGYALADRSVYWNDVFKYRVWGEDLVGFSLPDSEGAVVYNSSNPNSPSYVGQQIILSVYSNINEPCIRYLNQNMFLHHAFASLSCQYTNPAGSFYNLGSARCVADNNVLQYNANDESLGYIVGESVQTLSNGQTGSSVTATPYYNNVVFSHWSDGVLTATRQDTANGQPLVVTAYFETNCPENVVYQGESYPVVAVGAQCWLAKNLNAANHVTGNSICYDDLSANCDDYGRLYNWEAAMSVCPFGWELPSPQNITDLSNYIVATDATSTSNVARYLKSCRMENNPYCDQCVNSENGCSTSNSPRWSNYASGIYYGVDAYGFAALPGGGNYDAYPYVESFADINDYFNFWSSFESGGNARFYQMSKFDQSIQPYLYMKGAAFSVRCIQEQNYQIAPAAPTLATSTQTSITLTSLTGAEYRIEGGAWQVSPLFENLITNTDYTFYQRYAATQSLSASPSSVGAVLTTSDFPSCGVITGYNNEPYKTVQIGDQCWMAENYDVINYNNIVGPGTLSTTTPYNYVYDYNGTNADAARMTTNYQKYGVLYNYPAAHDMAPSGWRLPTLEDAGELLVYIDENTTANDQTISRWLKSCNQVSSTHCAECLNGRTNCESYTGKWDASSDYGIDYFGFSALPAGEQTAGSFKFMGEMAEFYIEDDGEDIYQDALYLAIDISQPVIMSVNPQNAYSVRYIKDEQAGLAPTLATSTQTSITLNTIYGYEYGVLSGSNIQWQDSPVFTGLIPGARYSFYQRYNSNNPASAPANFETKILTDCGTVVFDGLTYGTISKNGLCWLDRNLGATAVASSTVYSGEYGDLYQWGRVTDGHQIKTSWQINTQASSESPGHKYFITPIAFPPNYNWRDPDGVSSYGEHIDDWPNPCPYGWVVPGNSDLTTEKSTWISSNLDGAFNSTLKWANSYERWYLGYISSLYSRVWQREGAAGNLTSQSMYYSSSQAGLNSSTRRSTGAGIRCIKR